MSFFEIYSGKCFDLFGDQNQIKILEDKDGSANMKGIEEKSCESADELIDMLEYGFSIRQTHSTMHNDTSSRSHAICKIKVGSVDGSSEDGQLFIVDLAVSL